MSDGTRATPAGPDPDPPRARPAVLDSHQHLGSLEIPLVAEGPPDDLTRIFRIDEDELRQRCALMDRAGIDQAVVMPVNRYLMAEGSEATRRVNDTIAAYRDRAPDRFVAALGVAEPLHGAAGLDEIRRMREERGIVGVSYHSRWQGVATNDRWMLAHIECLGELGMIPFIHAHAESQIESPSMVGQLARSVPGLPVVVADALSKSGQLLHFIDVAHRCPNLFLETSLVYSKAALQLLVREIGPERLIFGSDTYTGRMVSQNSPAVIRGLELSDASADAILRSNMEALLARAQS